MFGTLYALLQNLYKILKFIVVINKNRRNCTSCKRGAKIGLQGGCGLDG